MSATKVLYVLATGRTGSTILGNVLGEVGGFFHAGELRTFWGQGLLNSRWCGCGVPVGECPFWSKVLAVGFDSVDAREVHRWQREAVRQRHALKFLRSSPQTPHEGALGSYIDTAGRLYRAMAEVGEASVIVDSSKRQQDAGILRLIPGIEPYFLHLVRDPRAVAYSWQRKKASPGAAGGRRTEMLRVGPMTSTRAWILSGLFGEAVRRQMGERYLRVRYEDFVADPKPTLEAVTRFVGEPWASLPLEGRNTVRLGPNHTAGGNPHRFGGGTVELRTDDEWVRGQRRSHRLAVTGMAIPMLRRYGYPIVPKPVT